MGPVHYACVSGCADHLPLSLLIGRTVLQSSTDTGLIPLFVTLSGLPLHDDSCNAYLSKQSPTDQLQQQQSMTSSNNSNRPSATKPNAA